MSRRPIQLVVLILFAGICGCAAAPPGFAVVDVEPVHAVARERFPGAVDLLATFDARPADEREGVRVVMFGVEVHGAGEVDRRLLWLESAPSTAKVTDGSGAVYFARVTLTRSTRITVTPKDGQPETRDYKLTLRPVTMRYCRADGEVVSESKIDMYEEPMRAGFWGYVDPDATQEQSDLCTLYWSMLQSLADEDETLQDLLFLVVEKPSIFSVIASFGVRVNLSWSVPELGPLQWPEPLRPDEGWGSEVRALQMQIDVNGGSALLGDLVACEPKGALSIGGGLCAAVFRHPTDEERWAVVRLLAVRGE